MVGFLFSGVGHFAQSETMAGFAKSRGVPAAKAGVLVSGAALVLGGLSVLLGIWGDLGALGLALTMIAITGGDAPIGCQAALSHSR